METKTNGTTPESTDTVLTTLHNEFVSTFKGKTTTKRSKELVDSFKKSRLALEAAEAAVENASKAASDAAKSIIREVSGKDRVTIGGVVYSPMCRGDKVFFRKDSATTLDLG